jgi:glutamine synthetase
MTLEKILKRAHKHGIKLVRFLYCDNGGIIRGKTTHVGLLADRMRQGIGLVKGMMSMTSLDFLAPDGSFGPVGEVRLVPDPGTFVELPYAPRSAQLICNLVTLDGEPWALCPRAFLERMVSAAAARGLRFDAAFENEFYLMRQTASGFELFDRSLCFSGSGMDSAEDAIQAIVAALTAQGLDVSQYMPELGPGQQELSIRHAGALAAADRQVVFRQTVRGVAGRQGLLASLAPKPFPDQAGNGAHIHISAWNRAHTKNLFASRKDPNGLTPLALRFIAGVLDHLPALLALTTPTVNSFRRLQPHFWSSAYVAWGLENREAAVRVPTTYWGNEQGSTNIELKPSDPGSNPYLALGAVIAAGLDGITRELDPAEPADRDPGNWSDEERVARGIAPYPPTLDQALDRLERDHVLREAIGEPLLQEYVRVKRAEAEHFRGKGDEYEVEQHRFKY